MNFKIGLLKLSSQRMGRGGVCRAVQNSEQSPEDLWDNMKQTNMHIMEVQEGEGGKGQKEFLVKL